MRLPNFFMIGAVRSGTTSVHNYLHQHPDIFMSSVKEPHYFSSDIDISLFRKDFAATVLFDRDLGYFRHKKVLPDNMEQVYLRKISNYTYLFERAGNEKIIGESSASYLFSRAAPLNIHESIPQARILIILRNPVDRAFSHYKLDLRNGWAKGTFLEAFSRDLCAPRKGWGVSNLYLELGMYYKQVKRYLELFPKKNVKIILFYELKANPGEALKDIATFLGVDPYFKFDTTVVHNKGKVPRYGFIPKMTNNLKVLWTRRRFPIINSLYKIIGKIINDSKAREFLYTDFKMTADERRSLIPYFAKDIENLSALIGKDLSHWTRMESP